MPEIKHIHVLPAETMLSNSHAWLNAPDIVAALTSDPLGAGALDKVRTAHADLVAAIGRKQLATTTIAELTRGIKEQHRAYTRLVRALHGFLTAFAESAERPDMAEHYLAVRDLLLPIGLSLTKRSHAHEHGAVLEVERRMTPDIEDFLGQCMVGTRSLLDIYHRWVATGKELGAMIKERARLQASLALSASVSPMHLRDARRVWMQVVRIFIRAVDLALVNPGVKRSILAPLRRDIADALAAQRSRLDRAGGAAPETIQSSEELETASAHAVARPDQAALQTGGAHTATADPSAGRSAAPAAAPAADLAALKVRVRSNRRNPGGPVVAPAASEIPVLVESAESSRIVYEHP